MHYFTILVEPKRSFNTRDLEMCGFKRPYGNNAFNLLITVVEQSWHVPSFDLIKLFKGHHCVPWVIHVLVGIKYIDMVAHILN